MQNTYHPIAAQLAKLENAKRSNLFYQELRNDDIFEDEFFKKLFIDLKEKFEITYSLLGDKNFKTLILLYSQTNPVQSAPKGKYGHNFADFLGTVEHIKSFYFIKYIAMLDWFWFITDSPKARIQLPKGTLKSWGSIAKGLDQIEIEIDESEVETLSIQKTGKEYQIISH